MAKSIMVFSAVTLVMAAALVAQASLPSQTQAMAVNKVLKHGPWTVTITGNVYFSPQNRTILGTLTATVTNATGVVGVFSATFNIVNGTGTATIHIALPLIGADITVNLDFTQGTVAATDTNTHIRKLPG